MNVCLDWLIHDCDTHVKYAGGATQSKTQLANAVKLLFISS